MKILRALGTVAVASTTLTVVAAFPAAADDTTTTFTLAGGNLTYTAATAAALTDGSTGAAVISGQLGDVSVTDARGGQVGWVVSGSSSTFTTTTGGGVGSESTAIAYTPGTVTKVGTSTIDSPDDTALGGAAVPVVSATDVSGNNTATWDAVLDVSLPATALAGDYTGTVTTSVL